LGGGPISFQPSLKSQFEEWHQAEPVKNRISFKKTEKNHLRTQPSCSIGRALYAKNPPPYDDHSVLRGILSAPSLSSKYVDAAEAGT
jgi:hypothetical protein